MAGSTASAREERSLLAAAAAASDGKPGRLLQPGSVVPGTAVWAKQAIDGMWHRGIVHSSVDLDCCFVQFVERRSVELVWHDGLRIIPPSPSAGSRMPSRASSSSSSSRPPPSVVSSWHGGNERKDSGGGGGGGGGGGRRPSDAGVIADEFYYSSGDNNTSLSQHVTPQPPRLSDHKKDSIKLRRWSEELSEGSGPHIDEGGNTIPRRGAAAHAPEAVGGGGGGTPVHRDSDPLSNTGAVRYTSPRNLGDGERARRGSHASLQPRISAASSVDGPEYPPHRASPVQQLQQQKEQQRVRNPLM